MERCHAAGQLQYRVIILSVLQHLVAALGSLVHAAQCLLPSETTPADPTGPSSILDAPPTSCLIYVPGETVPNNIAPVHAQITQAYPGPCDQSSHGVLSYRYTVTQLVDLFRPDIPPPPSLPTAVVLPLSSTKSPQVSPLFWAQIPFVQRFDTSGVPWMVLRRRPKCKWIKKDHIEPVQCYEWVFDHLGTHSALHTAQTVCVEKKGVTLVQLPHQHPVDVSVSPKTGKRKRFRKRKSTTNFVPSSSDATVAPSMEHTMTDSVSSSRARLEMKA